jgi:hypothetical protein
MTLSEIHGLLRRISQDRQVQYGVLSMIQSIVWLPDYYRTSVSTHPFDCSKGRYQIETRELIQLNLLC